MGASGASGKIIMKALGKDESLKQGWTARACMFIQTNLKDSSLKVLAHYEAKWMLGGRGAGGCMVVMERAAEKKPAVKKACP